MYLDKISNTRKPLFFGQTKIGEEGFKVSCKKKGRFACTARDLIRALISFVNFQSANAVTNFICNGHF